MNFERRVSLMMREVRWNDRSTVSIADDAVVYVLNRTLLLKHCKVNEWFKD